VYRVLPLSSPLPPGEGMGREALERIKSGLGFGDAPSLRCAHSFVFTCNSRNGAQRNDGTWSCRVVCRTFVPKRH